MCVSDKGLSVCSATICSHLFLTQGEVNSLWQNFTSSFVPTGCREMHSFGFVVKIGAQTLQKTLDIAFPSPGNPSPGNEGLKGLKQTAAPAPPDRGETSLSEKGKKPSNSGVLFI